MVGEPTLLRSRLAAGWLYQSKFPLSLPSVEDLLAERGIDITHELLCYWYNRFGRVFAALAGQHRTPLRSDAPAV